MQEEKEHSSREFVIGIAIAAVLMALVCMYPMLMSTWAPRDMAKPPPGAMGGVSISGDFSDG
jgi:hypothetical protein